MSITEKKVIECIDIVLEKLGTDVRRAIFFHLRREKDVKRYEIFLNPSKFIAALHSILGDAANVIEDEIIRTIEAEFNLNHNEDQDLLDLITNLKEKVNLEIEKEVIDNKDERKDLTYMQYSKHSKEEDPD
jgi:uncharacterized protein (DUF2461 family)